MHTASSLLWSNLIFLGIAAVSCTGQRSGDRPPASEAGAPDEPRVTYAALELVASCDAAVDLVKARALANMNASIDANKNAPAVQWCVSDAGVADSAAPPADGAGQTSMTNNQVVGVDEADFIKNDNKYLYAAMNGALRIVQAWPAADAREVSSVKLEGTPKKLFVNGDRALVYVSLPRTAAVSEGPSNLYYEDRSECSYGYDCQFDGDGTATALLVFDVSDRAAPKQLRRIDLRGSLLAARRIGDAVHTVAVTPELTFPGVELMIQGEHDCDGSAEEDPKRAEKYEALRRKNTEIIQSTVLSDFLPSVTEDGRDYAQHNCDALYREIAATGTAFTQVISVDMAAANEPVVATVLSKPGPVYASAESLYMAVLSDDARDLGSAPDQRKLSSAIHKFRIGSDPGTTRYVASGKVKGHVLNQFSMDEHAQHLRVATSWGKVPRPDVHSTMSVLEQRDDKLEVAGMVDRIAPSEDIRSVRFDGERGFIVTFKKTDPLYAFDLADPKAPRITGELKIPGFSTYMHMLDDQHLLTIGYDAADQGDFAFFTGVLLQIFDVSDPANLTLAHKVSIGTRGTSSEALTNHLAFTLFQGKLAVPMTVCEGGNEEGGFGSKMTFSGLMVFDVSVADGIAERGRVAHPNLNSDRYDDMGCSNWWTRAGSIVQRSVFMDDFVYSIAQDVVRVQKVDALGTDVATVPLHD